MKITVVKGTGQGRTLLSSFDSALRDAGVYNYNLIPLSSVIPPQSEIVRGEQYQSPDSEYGDRLYLVKAEMRGDEIFKYVGAGVGWYQYGDDKRGLFVEHEIKAETEEAVQSELVRLITTSLQDLCEFRNIPYVEGQMGMEINIAQITDKPTTVIVLAVYQSQPWEK